MGEPESRALLPLLLLLKSLRFGMWARLRWRSSYCPGIGAVVRCLGRRYMYRFVTPSSREVQCCVSFLFKPIKANEQSCTGTSTGGDGANRSPVRRMS